MIAINLIQSRVCSSRNHSSKYDADPVVRCGACARLFCITCEGATDGLTELCDPCWFYVFGSANTDHIVARRPEVLTDPETLCEQNIRLMKLLLKHGALGAST